MIDKKTCEIMRENLPTIRAFAGWTLEDLSKMLDVSRATAVKIENKHGALKTIYYLAIQKLIENELANVNDKRLALSNAINILEDPENKLNGRMTRMVLINEINILRKKVGKRIGSDGLRRICCEWLMRELYK